MLIIRWGIELFCVVGQGCNPSDDFLFGLQVLKKVGTMLCKPLIPYDGTVWNFFR